LIYHNDELLTDENFLVYAAKHYENGQLESSEEFTEDLDRIKYVKKLITRYTEDNVLKHQLVMNHIVVLCNVFGPAHTVRMLYLKLNKQFSFVKPFLIKLGIMPEVLYNIGDETIIYTDLVPLDAEVVAILRDVR